MALPTLSRRHVVTRSDRRSRRRTPKPSSVQKVSSPAGVNCARSESLRSTWMTNGSDSMEEQEVELDDAESCHELQTFVQLQRPLSDWVYWQRDAVTLPDCWTRVFAVLCDNLLWLYRYEDASAKSLLLRMRVTTLDVGADARQLHFRDAATAECVQLYMPDARAFHRWHSHVTTAVAKFPLVEEEGANRQRDLVPAVASAMHKKSFWKALATVLVAATKTSNYYQVAGHEEQTLAVYGRQRKSLGQRWKSVTTTLRGALKLHKRPQLQL